MLRFLKILIAGLLLAICLVAVGWWLEPPPARREVRQYTIEERRWIEQRHRYHGIVMSIYAGGEHYFYRDEKKCRL